MSWSRALLLIMITACTHPDVSPLVPPLRPVPFDRADWRPVTRFLDSAVAVGAAPGAVLGVSRAGLRFFHSTGQLGADEPSRPGPETIYDLASLTKVVGLTTAIMFAVSERRVELDAPVQRYVPAFAGPEKSLITVRMLLAHAGGLPAWQPLFRAAASRADVFRLADNTALEFAPGTRELYSDLGAIVLTQMIESVYQTRIDSILELRLFRPLGMTSTRYLPPAEWLDRTAPTELDPFRGRVLRGEVHDENAAAMAGVSGHAGLFGSAEDLLVFAEWMLAHSAGESGGRAVGRSGGHSAEIGFFGGPPDRLTVPPPVFHEFTRRQELVPGSSRALGWDTPSPESSAGHLLSPSSFGHTGFTGTSLWIDPERQLALVLLSNRVNPTRDNPRWTPVRAGVADLVMTTLYEEAR